MTNTAKDLAAIALLLWGWTPAAAQSPPAAEKGQEPPPVADSGTTAQSKCIAEDDDYKMSGNQPMFMIALENKCEQRMKCKVFAYITSAKGAVQGRGTILLAPKSSGAAAKKSYAIRVKMFGGSSQSARECRAI